MTYRADISGLEHEDMLVFDADSDTEAWAWAGSALADYECDRVEGLVEINDDYDTVRDVFPTEIEGA